MRPLCYRGSFLDADHPCNGVLIPRRNTFWPKERSKCLGRRESVDRVSPDHPGKLRRSDFLGRHLVLRRPLLEQDRQREAIERTVRHEIETIHVLELRFEGRKEDPVGFVERQEIPWTAPPGPKIGFDGIARRTDRRLHLGRTDIKSAEPARVMCDEPEIDVLASAE